MIFWVAQKPQIRELTRTQLGIKWKRKIIEEKLCQFKTKHYIYFNISVLYLIKYIFKWMYIVHEFNIKEQVNIFS